MKVNFGTPQNIQTLVRDLERSFGMIPENSRRAYSVTLDFSAPASVPGFTSQNVSIEGVELGDTVIVAASSDVPAGFMPPVGFVSADGVVTVRWLQVTGAAADPDGAGATYTIDLWRH